MNYAASFPPTDYSFSSIIFKAEACASALRIIYWASPSASSIYDCFSASAILI